MPSLSAFAQFINETGPAYLKNTFGGPGVFNDALRQNTEGLNLVNSLKVGVQGGSSIRQKVLLEASNLSGPRGFGEQLSFSNVSGSREVEVPWRRFVGTMAFTEAEVMLNAGASASAGGGGVAVAQQYANLRAVKFQELYTSLVEGLDDQVTAAASVANQVNGDHMYSIRSFVTADGGAPNGFTTVAGLNPVTHPNWQNQSVTYQPDNRFDPRTGIFAAFTQATYLTKFSAPNVQGVGTEHFHASESSTSTTCILTRLSGVTDFHAAMRASNDVTYSRNDAGYPSVTFLGNEIKHCAAYDDEVTGVGTADQPIYHWLDTRYLKLIVHSQRFLHLRPIAIPDTIPDTMFATVECWGNLMPISRRRLCHIGPA